MNVLERLGLYTHLLRWRLTWNRYDLDHLPDAGVSAKFMTARNAIGLVPDNATVISCGLGSNARCAIFYRAARDRFDRTAHPCGLTWISVGAQGGRGRIPGTIEELAQPGLVTRYITGHTETVKALSQLAEEGQLELHVLPQGEMARLIDAQGTGEHRVVSTTGIGTFLDPRVGRGSPVSSAANSQLVTVDGDALSYTLPLIDVAMFSAPYADAEGNIYFTHAATITENVEAARAARRNGGRVLVTVADMVDKDPASIGLPADAVDAIVVDPNNEQTGSVHQRAYWPMFTAGAAVDERAAEMRLRFLNESLHITPHRGEVDNALARLGAAVFADCADPGDTVNIGVGFPEEVCRVLCECGLSRDLTFTTEAGAYGGLPAPGVFFGAAVNPERLESSAWMFRHYADHLDVAVLGFLQVDHLGNVNASRRGPRLLDYVGPGGFPSVVDAAHTLIFVGSWMHRAQFAIEQGRLRVVQPGAAKFVRQVDEITFNASVARDQGKRVFYVSHFGVMELGAEGLQLCAVMPGIDVERDLLGESGLGISVLPSPRTVDAAVLTGAGFTLDWSTA